MDNNYHTEATGYSVQDGAKPSLGINDLLRFARLPISYKPPTCATVGCIGREMSGMSMFC